MHAHIWQPSRRLTKSNSNHSLKLGCLEGVLGVIQQAVLVKYCNQTIKFTQTAYRNSFPYVMYTCNIYERTHV